jgi:phage terminase small subunit
MSEPTPPTRAELQAAFDAALARLRGRHPDFVLALLRGLSQTAAAIAAGYSESSARKQGSRLSTNVDILAALELGRQLAARDAVMDAAEVLARLARHARGSMEDFLALDEREVTITTWEEVPRDELDDDDDDDNDDEAPRRRRVIKRVETERRPVQYLDLRQAQARGALHLVRKFRDGKDGIAIELYDAQKALQLLGQAHGLFKDGDDILKYIDMTRLSVGQLTRLRNGEDPLAVLLSPESE